MSQTINQSIIFWDFDGVILDSMSVRDQGFVEVLKDFPNEQVELLLSFHRKNGGLSRYVKFRYFFETIRGEEVNKEFIDEWAARFSKIMKSLLTDKKLLILDSLEYIQNNYRTKTMYITSGSDQTELRYLCKELGISVYFKSIHGSPTPKTMLVKELLAQNKYEIEDCVLIGDSINDYEAAESNQIYFMGYNNVDLKRFGNYINEFPC